jgi:3-hydroxyacyl-[acyl-carrier-protein] dehydratase
MRWMWIDRVVELEPGKRLVAIKNVSLAEEHLHDHFEAVVAASGEVVRPAIPVMPTSLILEGIAQTAGILVGHAEGFKEKVILAKLNKASIDREAGPGCVLRYAAEIVQMSPVGASCEATIELAEPSAGTPIFERIGSATLMFSHLDQNMSGQTFPEHNFVFGEGFKTLLRTSGVEVPA